MTGSRHNFGRYANFFSLLKELVCEDPEEKIVTSKVVIFVYFLNVLGNSWQYTVHYKLDMTCLLESDLILDLIANFV